MSGRPGLVDVPRPEDRRDGELHDVRGLLPVEAAANLGLERRVEVAVALLNVFPSLPESDGISQWEQANARRLAMTNGRILAISRRSRAGTTYSWDGRHVGDHAIREEGI